MIFNNKIGYYGELNFNGFEWEFVTLTGMRKYYDTYEEAIKAIEAAGLTKAE